MDGREAMAFPGGSASYYMHREGVAGSVSGTQAGGYQSPPGFRPLLNTGIPAQPSVQSGSIGSTFSVEHPHANFSHGSDMGASPGAPSGEHVKKKRGRPRKYAPDGPISLALSPMSGNASCTPGSSSPSNKRARGRPPGSGRKQQLATFGEWMNSSAGMAFAPHVIIVGAGEDIVAKLLSISQQRPRALCILSGTGTVSSVTLRQPASTGISASYEGRFQILCLSGSYLVAEDGGPRSRTGGVSASLSTPDGHVLGGAVATLTAAGPVQVVVCSFVYGATKTKTKPVTASPENESSVPQLSEKVLASPASAPPAHSYNPLATSIWPGSKPGDMKSTHTGIDLMRG